MVEAEHEDYLGDCCPSPHGCDLEFVRTRRRAVLPGPWSAGRGISDSHLFSLKGGATFPGSRVKSPGWNEVWLAAIRTCWRTTQGVVRDSKWSCREEVGLGGHLPEQTAGEAGRPLRHGRDLR